MFPLPPGSIDDGRVYVKALFDQELLFNDPFFEDVESSKIETLLRELVVRGRRGDDTLSEPFYTVNGDAG